MLLCRACGSGLAVVCALAAFTAITVATAAFARLTRLALIALIVPISVFALLTMFCGWLAQRLRWRITVVR